MNAILEKKHKFVTELSKILRSVDVTKSLDILDNAEVPLSKVKSKLDQLNDVVIFSRLIHADLLLNMQEHLRPMDKLIYQQYQSDSHMLQLEAIQTFLTSHKIEYTEDFFKEWSSWFRKDPFICVLYSSVINSAYQLPPPPNIIHFLQELIESDKTFALSNFETSTSAIKFRSFRLVPQTNAVSMATILEELKVSSFKELTDTTLVILKRITPTPLEVTTWVLKNPYLTKELVGEYFPLRGVTKGVIERCQHFIQLPSSKWQFSHEIIKPKKKKTGGSGDVSQLTTDKTELFIDDIQGKTIEDIEALVSPYGKVSKIVILSSPKGKSKGRGFIIAATSDDANSILANQEKIGYPISRKISRMEYLFPSMDPIKRCKLKVDSVALHTITVDFIALEIANIIKEKVGADITIIDATAGVGGCTFAFANTFKKVIAYEIDEGRYKMLVHNLPIVTDNKVETHNEDFTLSTANADVIFVDPPWGGEIRHDKEIMELHLGQYDLKTLAAILLKRAKLVVFRVPPNYDFESFYNKYPNMMRRDLKGQSLIMISNTIGGGEEKNYVIEQIGKDSWRFLCPFISSNRNIPTHLMNPFVAYLENEKFPRMELFNKTAQAIILDRMFFSTSMVPNMKFLEEKAEDQDMASIKHSLNIALNKYLDTDVTNYYDALVIVQKQDIRSVIINTLTEEFRTLIELDTFKSVIERSSFPTSEILLSYVNEMQQFAHVIHKTLIEEFTSLQKESDNIKLLLQKAISNTLNEKIKQEGSILKVIDLKSRLLSIGF